MSRRSAAPPSNDESGSTRPDRHNLRLAKSGPEAAVRHSSLGRPENPGAGQGGTGLIAACPLAVCQADLWSAWQPSLIDGAWPVTFRPGRSCLICPSVHAQCSACFAWRQTSPQATSQHTRLHEGPPVALRALFSLPANDQVRLSLNWTRRITSGFRRPSVA